MLLGIGRSTERRARVLYRQYPVLREIILKEGGRCYANVGPLVFAGINLIFQTAQKRTMIAIRQETQRRQQRAGMQRTK